MATTLSHRETARLDDPSFPVFYLHGFDFLFIHVFNHQIKETRRAVKDSESGLERMAIGHHIQDKGHVVEKKYNKKTGERELNQNFQNMDECTLV